MSVEPSELESLKLLSDMRAELRDALNALGGRLGESLLEHYAFYTAAHINRPVEGYVYLRESGRVEASKASYPNGDRVNDPRSNPPQAARLFISNRIHAPTLPLR